MTRSCAVARYLAARIDDTPCLELLAPVTLNIVCFRVVVENEDLDTLNGELVKDLHESGIAAPSTTTLHGKRAIRAAIVNHRTTEQDADILLNALLDLAETRTGKTLHRASAETLPA